MDVFHWRDRCPDVLEAFGRAEMARLQARIPDLPDFRCAERSRLPVPQRACTRRYAAVAHVTRFQPGFARMRRDFGPWLVEFNARFPHVYNMQRMLYHELAHFICASMNHSAPVHGLLWASCCDALMQLMGQGKTGLAEGTDYLFWCSRTEQQRTLRAERIADEDEWRLARGLSASIIGIGLPPDEEPIAFDALRELCMRATINGWELGTTAGVGSLLDRVARGDHPGARDFGRLQPYSLSSNRKLPASVAAAPQRDAKVRLADHTPFQALPDKGARVRP